MTDVAIVGMGAVFPGAADAPTFWRNITAGTDAITAVPPGRWDPEVYYRPDEDGDDRFYCRRGGFVDDLAHFDPGQFGIMPAAIHGIEPDQLLVLRAAAEAIADCGSLPGPDRVGVVIGRGGYLTPGIARLGQRVHTAHQLTAVLRDLVPCLPAQRLDAVRAAFQRRLDLDGAPSSIGLVPNFAASRIANRFDLRGPAYTVDAACASSLVAVDHAVTELASHRCDAVLAGGVHTCHHPTLWSVFTQLRALSRSEVIRPFDARADGTLLSEGAGVVLLKRLADADAAGDRVYAVVRGVGVASDGRATSMMNPVSEGQELAMRRAWAAAGLDPAEPGAIGLLEAHGTATPLGDEVELATVARVFGPGSGRATAPIGIGTVKSMIGHAMPAAGAAGLIKAAFALHHGVMPPTLHLEEPHPALARTRCEPVRSVRAWDDGVARRAAVSAFGFGGINTHVVLEVPGAPAPGRRGRARTNPRRRLSPSPAGPHAQATGGATRTTAVPAGPAQAERAATGPAPEAQRAATGPAPEAILRLAADCPGALARQLDVPDADLLGQVATDPGSGACRLAIVAPDARRLALARKVVTRGAAWRGRSDVWFAPVPLLSGPEHVAFVFPGFEPEFSPHVGGVAAAFGLAAPPLRGGATGVGPGGGVVELAHDVIAVSRLFAAVLHALDITPGVMAGHSLGEWTAMIVAGVYPEIDEFLASMGPGMVEVPDVVYLALGTPADQAAGLFGDEPGLAVTHDNCPHQSVVCGPESQVSALAERARAAGVLAQALPFRTGFHSPVYAPYLGAARELLDRLVVRPARVPLWSATSLAPFPSDPAGLRELVLRHLVEPVRFRPLTHALHETGVRAFVQVGIGSLTGFIEDTLRGRDHLTVATTVAQRDGVAQVRRVAAALWAHGLTPRFDRLPATATARTPGAAGAATLGGRKTGVIPGLAEASGHAVRLSLGTPLVRLPGIDPLPLAGEAPPPYSSQAPSTATPDSPTPVRSAGAAAGPAPGDVRSGAGQAVMSWEFSLRSMPELADHAIFPQAPGWPDDSDRFPVVPMTTLLDVMAAAAPPGRVVTGFEQVTATRWLTVAPATTARVLTAPGGADRVRVRVEGYAAGNVLLGDGYPVPPPPGVAPLHAVRAAPVTARSLYEDRWMFHGPRFAGVADITSLADDGITGEVVNLPAPGALLDSAGQLIGHWMQVSRTVDQTVLPTGIRAVRWYGPPPPVGERLRCTAWIREVSDTEMRADAELRTSDGQVRCRIEGWTTRRFATDDAIWQMKFRPEQAALSGSFPGGWHVVWERWPDTASRELTMRSYLNAAERASYERLTPRQQRPWLLGRIAAKDCVRRSLWDRGAGPIFPAEVTVDGGDDVSVRGPFRTARVWLAHRPADGPDPACAVAVMSAEPVQLAFGTGEDGRPLATCPGREPCPLSPTAPDPTAPAMTLDTRRN